MPPGATIVGVPGRVVENDSPKAARFAAYAVVQDCDDPYSETIRTLVEHSQELDQIIHVLRAKMDRLEREIAQREQPEEPLRAVK